MAASRRSGTSTSSSSRRGAPPPPPPPAPKKKKSASAAAATRMKSEAGVAADPVLALQQQLSRQLAQAVKDTVGAVCSDFARELRRPAKSASPAGAASTADYELYYSCCKRLVAYIAANMTTSPDFAAQMDRIILACHSRASERVLRTVATKNVWFHRRDGGADGDKAAGSEEEEDEEEEEEEEEEEVVDDDDDDVVEMRRPSTRTTPPTRAPPAPKKSPVRPIKKEKKAPARPTRSLAKKAAELPPPRAASKRRASAAGTESSPASKRLRPARRRSLPLPLPLPTYDDDDDSEDDDNDDEPDAAAPDVGDEAPPAANDDENDDDTSDDDDDELPPNQPHFDGTDELLDFTDPVRDMCYVDKRTPAQTKFFKERLRKAILFVDAQLCKPPPGKVCGSDCKKIRAVMCDRNLPCRNKICRVWHDVEVHIDRCQNTHCELKNRVMLRETMHKIDHKKLQIQQAKLEVAAKKRERDAIKGEEADEREQFIELTLLTNEIEQLESDVAAAEEELGILNGTKKAFWACLNVVGIELKDDVADSFPDLAAHYVGKKQPAIKPRAPKRAAKDMGVAVPANASQSGSHTDDADADADAAPNDDGPFSPGGASNPMAPITRRTTRRSTTKSFQAMSMDAVSAESDEESKSIESNDAASAEEKSVDSGGAGGESAEVSAPSSIQAADVVESQENSVASDDGAAERAFAGKDESRAIAQVLSDLLPDTAAETTHAESQVVVTAKRVEMAAASLLSVGDTQTESQLVATDESVDMMATAMTTVTTTTTTTTTDPEHRAAGKSTTPERRRSVAKSGSSRRMSAEAPPPHVVAQLAAAALAQRRQSMVPRPSMLSASLASFASEGFTELGGDNDTARGSAGGESSVPGSGTIPSEVLQLAADASEDADDPESAEHNNPLELQVEMLRGKLARRNVIIEVIRRAYYHDVIVVKEELRHARLAPPSRESSASSGLLLHSAEERLSAVPSVDLRDALQLFAPAETVLQVHPCASCGGHLELVHGESKELQAARQEMARASKGEQQMRGVVHRMRTEAKEMEEVNEALQQRVKALTKENSYTLEQLQAARRAERDQRASIATLRAKLQLAHTTQEEVDRLAAECKDAKQQLVRSNHDRDIFSASNNHLKEELSEVTRALHQAKVDKAQLESDFGATFYRLQEEIKKTKQLADDFSSQQQQLREKTTLSDELQRSLVALKEELSTSLQRSEQTKRHLEDQLVDEERAREELQEHNLALRKTNKRLATELEALAAQGPASRLADRARENGGDADSGAQLLKAGDVTPAEMKGLMRKRLGELQQQLEWSQMRENDLLALVRRQDAARSTVAPTKPAPPRRALSRMPSTTVITRFLPNPDSDVANAAAASAPDGDSGSKGAGPRTGGLALGASGDADSDGLDEQGDDGFDDDGSGAGTLEIDEKNFEAYHQEVHRMLTEIEEGRSRSQKQQKTIADMERKQQALVDRLEEAKLTIEALTGSVNALKLRLNQDSAGAAEELEDMLRQLEEGRRDQLYEAEKTRVLKEALRSVSERVFEFSDNQLLLADIVVDFPTLDDEPPAAPAFGGAADAGDAQFVPELYRKKQELRRKVAMEKAMKRFGQECHSRSEIVNLEVRKLRDALERLRDELDEAENKIDSDQLQLRSLEAETAKLRLTVEMGKNSLLRSDKALKTTTEDLQDALKRSESHARELDGLRAEHAKLLEDQRRLTMMLFEKTKAWEKEISANDRASGAAASRDALHSKLQDVEELADFRRRTNRSVEVSAVPVVSETEMQTDRWKPHGLILRQRNSPDSMPQRFLGKASVLIACPEFASAAAAAPLLSGSSSSLNQEFGGLSPLADAAEHRRRDVLELAMYPSMKAGGRQIKTSHGSSRPKALSKLYLASDGISQKYMAPSPRQAFEAPAARPFTSQS
ncbi:hypothetical protein PybrP1_008866 [[Pythium] brassicae (nom. inval.)]|nr:hypothetical protein PybrP1_008866 [[Pythium] brassicae (nom. inval.)]